LKDWCIRSKNLLLLELPKVMAYPKGQHFSGDCLLVDYPEASLAYLDPPYTQHVYGSYYHIWDSIALWDKPETLLRTHKRADRTKNFLNKNMVSKWNNKREALDALITLIDRLPVSLFVISYNNEGLISEDALMKKIKDRYRSIDILPIEYKRHIMSSIGNSKTSGPASRNEAKEKNTEFLISFKK
jgi:adenine-specific DNA-methyltransferase